MNTDKQTNAYKSVKTLVEVKFLRHSRECLLINIKSHDCCDRKMYFKIKWIRVLVNYSLLCSSK